MSIIIRDKDILTDEDIINISVNWGDLPEEENTSLIQRILLYYAVKIKELENRIEALENP